MTRERRICACRGYLECEADQSSVEHTVRIHNATEQHQEFVAAVELAEERLPSLNVPLGVRSPLNGWPVSTLRRVV